jgi:hypothetical protein
MRFLALFTVLSLGVACAPAGANIADADPEVVVETTENDGPIDVPHAFVLTDLQVYKVVGEWPIEPGDTVRVDVRLVNPTTEGWYEYPGVRLETEPSIAEPGDFMFYGILPRSSLEATFDVVVPADFEGDTLTVRTRFTTLAEDFVGGDVISIDVPIGR